MRHIQIGFLRDNLSLGGEIITRVLKSTHANNLAGVAEWYRHWT